MAGKLQRITQGLDQVWEDLIYDPCTLLPTLFEVDTVDERWLPYLKPQLGFTDDLSFDATTEELRRLLNNAVPYWNEKPSESGVINNAIRMVTGNRFRVQNYFDFRMQEDKTCITEELEDFDPNAIGFPTNKWSGSLGLLTIVIGSPFGGFDLSDAPELFGNEQSVWAWIVIEDPTYPANDGIYKILLTTPLTRGGQITEAWPVNHGGWVKWQLVGYAGEFTSEVRLVDQGVGTLVLKAITAAFGVGEKVIGSSSGATGWITAINTDGDELTLRSIVGRFEPNEAVTDTGGGAAEVKSLDGVLNRELLAFLMGGRTVRPFGERIDVVYINFLDRFLTPGDFDQWEVNDIDLVSIPSPAGPCRLLAGGRIVDADPYHSYWWDQVVAWKITPIDADTSVDLIFWGQDTTNQYHVNVDYDTKAVSLYKVVAGTPTQLGTVTLTYLKQGVQDVIRVDALQEGTGVRIRVKVNGETEIDVGDDPYAFNVGMVGAQAVVSTVDLQLVEVNVLPTEIDRIGPNP